MIGAVVRGRTLVRLLPFACAPLAYRGETDTKRGVSIMYVTRHGSRAVKTFYNVDELGAFMAFEKHCEMLDRVLAQRKSRAKAVLTSWRASRDAT